uniref:Odorant-binding protein 22 n=1 Tax=Encarsia formosa TaxID=32400 RepID=A0A514TTZ7_ENCFO|nr:odorant-binding protein 22 [Encarsia formosa]
MKYALCLVASCLLMAPCFVSAEFDITFMAESLGCADELGITADEAKEILKTRSDKVGCIHACLIRKFDAFDGNGKVISAKLLSVLDDNKAAIDDFDKIKALLVACIDEAEAAGYSSECEAAKKIGDCLVPKLRPARR